MSISEKDAVLRERAAVNFVVSYLAGRGYLTPGTGVRTGEDPKGEVERHVLSRYPLPKVTRPRVVYETAGLDGEARRWRFVGGRFQTSFVGGAWTDSAIVRGVPFCPGRVTLLAELLANPTEEVEE